MLSCHAVQGARFINDFIFISLNLEYLFYLNKTVKKSLKNEIKIITNFITFIKHSL